MGNVKQVNLFRTWLKKLWHTYSITTLSHPASVPGNFGWMGECQTPTDITSWWYNAAGLSYEMVSLQSSCKTKDQMERLGLNQWDKLLYHIGWFYMHVARTHNRVLKCYPTAIDSCFHSTSPIHEQAQYLLDKPLNIHCRTFKVKYSLYTQTSPYNEHISTKAMYPCPMRYSQHKKVSVSDSVSVSMCQCQCVSVSVCLCANIDVSVCVDGKKTTCIIQV